MSVRKREWTTEKGEKKTAWVADYVDAGGKRRQKTFDLKKKADAYLATVKAEIREGTHVADSVSSTVEAAGKLWLLSAKDQGLERTSVEGYERTLRIHIVPFIGTLKLSTLSIARIRSFEDTLREAGRSLQMIKVVLVHLGMLIADAQERGLVSRNIIRDLKGRRGSREQRLEKRNKSRLKVGEHIPTREEAKALVSVLQGKWRPLILTAVFCGLRASELRGLRWQDIDLVKGQIRVHQRADSHNDIGKTKSASSERTVPAPPMVINSLKEWKLSCPKRDSRKVDSVGNPIMVLELAFPNREGRVLGLNNIIRQGLHPAWIAAGVTVETGEVDKNGRPVVEAKYTGLHALRHFYASWCINRRKDGGLELPPKVVQDRLGHSTIAMTMDTYGHLFPRGDDTEEMAEAERAFLA